MALKNDTPMPSLSAITVWFNGQVAAEDLRGGPTLIHFWSVSCGICPEQMPELNRWRETYGPRGLKLVAVHKPRSEKDMDLDAVQAAVTSHGLTHPVAVDNEHVLTDTFENKAVPEFFLFDSDGQLRMTAVGELGLPNLEKLIVLLCRASQVQGGARP